MTLLEAAVRTLSQATSVHFRALHLAIQHYLAEATILGRRASHNAKLWFWSGQNATKLQIVGLSMGHHEVVHRAVSRTF
ncbi:oxidoreductase C-terminal domain-containing protein [Ruegeria sp.]|uniref:oxidoreductase C-terminal domain-containing protein n=1 Tax=Ruegeria sp. TaxID=1879320 RepID=UPI003B00CC84